MKKGFTLVELLAVIVILGLILSIAIPRITELIENARINAYIQNEEMMLRAAMNYIALNEEELPSEIGDTKELSLEQLQTDELISVIKDPNNKYEECNGYILITKIEENDYDYTPHLKCGDSKHIGSSSNDGLILHYKFNDFQEPTQNIYSVSDWTGHGSSWQDTGKYHNGMKVFKNTVVNPDVNNNFGFRYLGDRALNSDKYKISIGFYVQLINDPQNMKGYVRVRYTDGSYQNHSWNYSPNVFTNFSQYQEQWQWVTATVNLNQSKIPDIISRIYVYRDRAPEGAEMNISGIQVENKPYSTSFVDGIREGIVKDYSGNNNIAELLIETTPRWVYNQERSSGVYDFNGGNVRIDSKTDLNISGNDPRTITGWMNTRNGSIGTTNFTVVASHGTESTGNDFSLGVKQNKIAVGYWGSYTEGITTIENNKWYHVVAIYDGAKTRIYLNGKFEAEENRQINTPSGPLRIGNRANDVHTFDGLIDDVRIYDRVLSEEEVKLLYETTR